MSPYTPTTEEVRSDYAILADNYTPRGKQFDRWLTEVKAEERMRIKDIINKETFHYGKTHYEGINCVVCRIYGRIDDDK